MDFPSKPKETPNKKYRPINGQIYKEDIERFWSKTAPGKNDCIIWTAACSVTPNGEKYGRFFFNGRVVAAHRFALYIENGIDELPSTHHKCFNTQCVNTKHLKATTVIENNQLTKKSLSPYCKNGHLRTYDSNSELGSVYITPEGTKDCRECAKIRDHKRYKEKYKKEKLKNTHDSEMRDFAAEPKLDVAEVKEIRHRYNSGKGSQRDLARIYKVSQTTIALIVRGKIWKDI